MRRIVYREIASALNAMRSCAEHHTLPSKSHLTEWIERHKDRALELTREYMPSGSGIDAGTTLNVAASTDDKLIFETSYHHMVEGMYAGWSEHTVIVRPSLIHTLDIRITGRDRNDIKSYLHDVFDMALRTTFDE